MKKVKVKYYKDILGYSGHYYKVYSNKEFCHWISYLNRWSDRLRLWHENSNYQREITELEVLVVLGVRALTSEREKDEQKMDDA